MDCYCRYPESFFSLNLLFKCLYCNHFLPPLSTPKSPDGLNNKKIKRRMKVIASLNPEGTNHTPKFSAKPIMYDPTIEAGTLVTPPITAPEKPLIIKFVPIVGERYCSKPMRIPAIAARTEPMMNDRDM